MFFNTKSDSIDRGIVFALNHNKKLLKLLFFPFLLQFFSAVFFYSSSVTTVKLQFLMLIAILLGRAWFLTSFTFYVLSVLKNEKLPIKEIVKTSLLSCPKVLLSCLSILFIFLLALDIPPAFLILFFLIWAPIFPALEQCVPESAEVEMKEKLEERLNELREREEEEGQSVILRKEKDLTGENSIFKPTWFVSKMFFSFGLSRSLQISSKHIKEGLILALLFWFSSVFPEFFSNLLSLEKNFFLILLEASVGSILFAYTIAISVVTLLCLLPEDARKELGLPKKLNKEFWLTKKTKRRFLSSGNKLLVISIFSLSLLSTVFLINNIISLSEIPKDISFRENASLVNEDDIVIELEVNSSEKKYTWMQLGHFYLDLNPVRKRKKSSEQTEINKLDFTKLKKAKRILYLNQSSERIKLSSDNLDTILKTRLYFPLSSTESQSLGRGQYQLYFKNQKAEVTEIIKGSYPKGLIKKIKRVKR